MPRRLPCRLPAPATLPLPFRWDVTHARHVGSLLHGDVAESYDDFLEHLLECCARVVALSGDADLVFVGRSPESLHDLLSGLLRETSWASRQRLILLPFSVGYTETAAALWRRGGAHAEAVSAFRAYLDSLGLSPAELTVRERPVAFVDLVCSGRTFHRLLLLIRGWAVEEKADWPAIQRKVRVIPLARRDDARPRPWWKHRAKPWRWREDAGWIDDLLRRGSLKEVSVDVRLWEYLADRQEKSTASYGPDEWGREEAALPCRAEYHLRALRLARHLFEVGRTKEVREPFTALLAAQREMRSEWLRRLVGELRT